MKQFYAYIHSRPNGMPFYIGKSQDLARPYSMKRKRNCHHKNIVGKYGALNIKVRVIRCRDEAHALTMEMQIIADLRKIGIPLTNMTDGGEGSSGRRFVMSSEHKAKISIANTGRIMSAEFCEKRRIASTGKSPSVETKLKLSIANKGKPRPLEVREKISAGHKGKTKSAAHRENISIAVKKLTISTETREKMRIGRELFFQQTEGIENVKT